MRADTAAVKGPAELSESAAGSPRALIVEDDAAVARLVDRALRSAGFETAVHASGEDALEALAVQELDLVVADIRMGGMDGIELCRRIGDNYPHIPVVVVTALTSTSVATAAMRAGAVAVLRKPFEVKELLEAAQDAWASRREQRRATRVPTDSAPPPPRGLLGSSVAWRRTLREARRVASSHATALLSGESGTGKEVLARALHEMSPRRDEPFVAVDCAAIPTELLESELFGHEKGAFTGADRDREGLLVQAGRGTLLLDELGSLPIALQPKLLRALQNRTVRPLGSVRERPFEARILAATNVDLHDLVDRGVFRADLLYRLEVLRIDVPPLRRRSADVLELARGFLAELAAAAGHPAPRLAPEAARQLERYPWPGNVRELRNCMEGVMALATGSRIELEDLPAAVRVHVPGIEVAPDGTSLQAVEGRHIERVLRSVNGNRAAAARVLGVSRSTLYRKIRKMGFDDATD